MVVGSRVVLAIAIRIQYSLSEAILDTVVYCLLTVARSVSVHSPLWSLVLFAQFPPRTLREPFARAWMGHMAPAACYKSKLITITRHAVVSTLVVVHQNRHYPIRWHYAPLTPHYRGVGTRLRYGLRAA